MTPTRSFDWTAAAKAGLASGLLFLVLEMTLVPLLLGGSPWAPPRMIAAIALGTDVLPPPAPFDAGVVAVAMGLHFALSAVYGVVVGLLVRRLAVGPALAVGALFGLALYALNFHVGPSLGLFPWFAMAQNGVSVFAHVVFGAVAAALAVQWSGRSRVALSAA